MQKLEEIDPNFKVNPEVSPDAVYYDPANPPFRIYGLAKNDQNSYCRLPLEFLPQCSEGVRYLSWHLAGGCIRFRTDSKYISVLWKLRERGNMNHFAASGQSGLQLYEETETGVSIEVGSIRPEMNEGLGCKTEQSRQLTLNEGMRSYCLLLPLYNGLEELLLGFEPTARVEAGRVPKYEKPLLFYGSSITQGGCAMKPGSCYPAILARRLDAAMVNLGFSGSGRGEECMARYIAGIPMSAFIMDYDHNAPTVEHLAKTHERFYQIVREQQPGLPIIMISKPDTGKDLEDEEARKRVIVRTYFNAISAGDKNVYYIDGGTLFGNTDRDLCTVDKSHPTDLGFLRMADHIEPVLRRALERQ